MVFNYLVLANNPFTEVSNFKFKNNQLKNSKQSFAPSLIYVYCFPQIMRSITCIFKGSKIGAHRYLFKIMY